jgi:glutathione peroxidase
VKKLKNILILVFMLGIVFWGYVMIVNKDSHNMTTRQKILKAVYPAWMWWAKLTGKNAAELESKNKPAPVSFYSLKTELNDGSTLDFSTLKGKKVLIVNTASDCGYTEQYEDLQHLFSENKGSLVIIGFPANDFKEQEKGSDAEIAEFCKSNFGIGFPLAKKSTVIKSPSQNSVFQWLTDSTRNGWNNKPPSWNFTKYLVDESGSLRNYFGPSISPMSKDIKQAIKEKN